MSGLLSWVSFAGPNLAAAMLEAADWLIKHPGVMVWSTDTVNEGSRWELILYYGDEETF